MIELPEALTLARQMETTLAGKKVSAVLPPTKPHKFCWFAGDPADYARLLTGCTLRAARGFGIYAELCFSDGQYLSCNDGVNLRYLLAASDAPKDYQLLIEFTDGTALACTVAMYGGIILHDGSYENTYYEKSLAAISPFSDAFPAYFRQTLAAAKPTLSLKAVLATEQRFPGLGNGVLQDILFAGGFHPKRKLSTLSDAERDQLMECVICVLREMRDCGGRDTEKDLFGNIGGYRTKMSKLTQKNGCPVCDAEIVKEAYLGGSVYYCPHCQLLPEERK